MIAEALMDHALGRLASRFLGIPFVLALGVGACGGGGGSSTPAPPVAVAIAGTLRPAPGLAAGDFEVWGTDDTAPSPGVDGSAPSADASVTPGVDGSVAAGATSVGVDGSFTTSVSGRNSGFLFAGPRPGTASAAKTGAGSGLYMAPALGGARIVGPPYKVADSGAAALD